MIKLELVTLSGVKFSDQVHEVLLPTPLGQIAVFAQHAPLVSLASHGELAVRRKPGDSDDYLQYYAVTSGLIEVFADTVRVLVDEAALSEEISTEQSRRALANAQALLASAKDRLSIDEAQAVIDREQTRLRVAELRRRKRR